MGEAGGAAPFSLRYGQRGRMAAGQRGEVWQGAAAMFQPQCTSTLWLSRAGTRGAPCISLPTLPCRATTASSHARAHVRACQAQPQPSPPRNATHLRPRTWRKRRRSKEASADSSAATPSRHAITLPAPDSDPPSATAPCTTPAPAPGLGPAPCATPPAAGRCRAWQWACGRMRAGEAGAPGGAWRRVACGLPCAAGPAGAWASSVESAASWSASWYNLHGGGGGGSELGR